MLRRCLSIVLTLALITATSAPTFAAGVDPYFGAADFDGPDNGFDSYRRSAELTTGVYLRIPFSGGLDHSVSNTRFGLAFGARLPTVDRYDNEQALADMPKLLDLSIGLRGKQSLRLNGLSMVDTPTLYADENGKPKKRKIWPWVVGGVVVLSVLAAVAIKGSAKDAGNAVGNALCGVLNNQPCTGT